MKHFLVAIFLAFIVSCSQQTSEQHLAAAKTHINNNDLQAASIELKNAIKLSPQSAEARFLLGKVYIQQKEYQGAEKELNKALELKHPASEVVPLLSQAYQKTQSDVALLELSHNDKGFSVEQSAQVALYKVQAMFRLQQNEQAKALINDIKQLNTSSVYKQLALVYSLLLEQELEGAEVQLSAIIAAESTQPDALKLNALLFAQQGKLVEAADIYMDYLSHYPEDTEITFVTARLLVQLNKNEEAEPLIDKLLTLNESHGLLNQLKGIVRFNVKDMEQALLHTEKAITASPSDPTLRLLAGYAAYQLENFESAHQHLSLIAQDLPAEHEALRVLAASQLRLGLHNDAGDTISAIEGLTDKDNALVSSVGLALVKSGEIDKARTVLSKSNELESSTAEDLTRLGILKLSLNDISGIAKLESALDKKPEQQFTRQTLATAYLSTQQLDKAIQLSERWKKESSDDLQAYLLAGAVYFQQKNIPLAQQEFEQALIIDPSYTPAQMALAELALQQEDVSLAQQHIAKVLAQQPDNIAALAKNYSFTKQPEAVALIEAQAKKNPTSNELKLLLAKVYLKEERPNEAITVLSEIDPKDATTLYWQTLGQAYYGAKNFDKLTNHYQQWLADHPSDREAVLSNLILFSNLRKYQEGMQLSEQYLAKNKNDIEIKLFDIHFKLILGNVEQAKTLLNDIPNEYKNLPFTKGLVGQVQITEKKFADALFNIQAAYQARPSARNARLMLVCLNNTGQEQAGQQFLKKHINAHNNDAESIMLLAQMQIANDVDGAIKSYQQALAINEDNFIALNNLAYFYLEREQLDLALEHASKALKLQPNNNDILDTVGRIYLEKNDYQTAVEHLSKAVNSGSSKEEIYLNYVEALALNNDIKLAQRKLTQRKFLEPKSQSRIEKLKTKFGI